MKCFKKHNTALQIVKRLNDAGHTAYFAGGCVRDALLNLPIKDIDIATSATPEQVQQLFSKTIPVGIAFGVVIVVEQGENFEVATFRSDQAYVDGRHPEGVVFSNPQEDAKRRDFTINGMFYDPLTDTIYDFVGGREDLEKKVIRAIGNPLQRFEEDKLRMIRAIRFATRFNFHLDEATREAIVAQADTLLPAVSVERIWQEFQKMSDMNTSLHMMLEISLLQSIFLESPDLKQLEYFGDFPNNTPPIIYLIELYHSNLCDFLKTSKEDERLALFFLNYREPVDDYEWACFYAHEYSQLFVNVEVAKEKTSLSEHQKRQERLAVHIKRRREREPIVPTQILLDRGLEPGPRLGEVIAKLERLAVNENLDGDALLAKYEISDL